MKNLEKAPIGNNEGAHRFTVITVVKNNLAGLKKTYQSLEEQEEQDFHWLVMDGQSSDGTLEWLAGVQRWKFRYLSRKDRSLFDAMNVAVSMLETEYCLFLNGGDFFWDSKVIFRILETIQNETFDFGYGQFVIGGVSGFPERIRGRRIKDVSSMFYGHIPCHQASIISKKAFQMNGGYQDDIGIWGDREWILRYAKKQHPSTFAYLPFVIAYCEPNGVSYQKFFQSTATYFRIHWRIGNFREFVFGVLGWFKTSVYVAVSKGLKL